MRKIAVVTTFSREGWRDYAGRMVTTWIKHWPTAVDLFLYPDEKVKVPCAPNVRVILPPNLEKQRFLEWASRVRRFTGQHAGRYNYRFDAVKFCHKPFALWHFAHGPGLEYDALIWLDADTLTHAPVPLTVVDHMMAPEGYDIQFLGRSYKYSECGYLYFNLRGGGLEVLDAWVAYYRDRTFKAEAEWHDSFLFDRARQKLPHVRAKDLTGHIPKRQGAGHPFVNSFLGLYLDHLKGDTRKATGKPRKHDLHADHDAPYWTENAHARCTRKKRP